MLAQKSQLQAPKNPSRTEVCAIAPADCRCVPDAARRFLNTEKAPSAHVFSALYYIFLSFKVSFLLLHSSGKMGLPAHSLTKQLLAEWNCWAGIFTQTPLLRCAGCWDGAPVGSPRRPPVPQTCWSGMGIMVDFISTAGLTKREVLPRPDIFLKVASLKHPMWADAPLN